PAFPAWIFSSPAFSVRILVFDGRAATGAGGFWAGTGGRSGSAGGLGAGGGPGGLTVALSACLTVTCTLPPPPAPPPVGAATGGRASPMSRPHAEQNLASTAFGCPSGQFTVCGTCALAPETIWVSEAGSRSGSTPASLARAR